jgi:hypothetical protein
VKIFYGSKTEIAFLVNEEVPSVKAKSVIYVVRHFCNKIVKVINPLEEVGELEKTCLYVDAQYLIIANGHRAKLIPMN